MPKPLAARYRDAAGDDHHVRLERADNGHWRVVDVGPHGEQLVEELCGHDDHRPQAEALACDYAEQAELAAQRLRDDHGDDVSWAA